MQFEFATAARIVFRSGAIADLPAAARRYGKHAFLVTGRSAERTKESSAGLESAGVLTTHFAVPGEPTVDRVREGATRAREQGCDVVIGFGGGGAIDAAKAIAILATHSGEPLDYLEVVGKGQAFEYGALPTIAVPTTAGTGAEVTRNAVLGSPAHGLKASLRGEGLLPKTAIVDPELTITLRPDVTAWTGMDALTQLLEPYVSSRANALVDCFCEEGFRRVRRSLPRVVEHGQDKAAREDMSFASLLSGLALANAGLGIVHGFAAPLGGMLAAPHGALVAAVLPHAVAVNIAALKRRAPHSLALAKYARASEMLTGSNDVDGLPAFLLQLTQGFGLPSLSGHGLHASEKQELVEKAARANSTKANPLVLESGELMEIVDRAL